MMQVAMELVGDARKKAGLDSVTDNNVTWLDRMRAVARRYVKLGGQVTVDQLREHADNCGDMPAHQNAWGAVFRGSEWVAIGFAKSTYATNNARRICVWTSTVARPPKEEK